MRNGCILDQRYGEAIPVLKTYLCRHPDNAGGHFYLGSSYLLSKSPWMVLARGEIETALALFEQQGGKSPIERFSDVYFELRCHLELAKILLRQMVHLVDSGAPPESLRPLVERAEETLTKARAIAPEAADVAQLEALVTAMRDAVGGAETAEKDRVLVPID